MVGKRPGATTRDSAVQGDAHSALQPLVFRRLLDVIDDETLHRAFLRCEL